MPVCQQNWLMVFNKISITHFWNLSGKFIYIHISNNPYDSYSYFTQWFVPPRHNFNTLKPADMYASTFWILLSVNKMGSLCFYVMLWLDACSVQVITRINADSLLTDCRKTIWNTKNKIPNSGAQYDYTIFNIDFVSRTNSITSSFCKRMLTNHFPFALSHLISVCLQFISYCVKQ